MNDLISIIVPVYNVKNYLKTCLNSLIKQTYDNIEIIIVDDGSTDESGLICDQYAADKKNIRVIHKSNGGLSDARNEGLRNANGDYVVFVDSDDYVDNTFIEILKKGFIDNTIDISCCAYLRFNDGTTPIKKEKNNKNFILSNTECIKYCYTKEGRNIDIVAWNKMYKKSLFFKNEITYPKGKYFEDLYTTYKLFFYSNNININTSQLYFYRQRTGSIMSTAMTKINYDNMLEGLKDSLYFYKENKIVDLMSLAYSMYSRMIIKTYYNSKKIKDKNSKKQAQNILFNDYKIIYKEFKKITNVGFIKTIVFGLFRFFPNIISQIIK